MPAPKSRRSRVKGSFPGNLDGALGFSAKLQFAHAVTEAGEQDIDLNNLNNPTGFNPDSMQSLASAQIKLFPKNLTLYKGNDILIPGVSYTILSNTRIRLNFETVGNEIFFGIIDSGSLHQLQGVSAKMIYRRDILPAGQTDINVGEFYQTGEDHPQLMLFVDRLEQSRNDNNGLDTTGGDYQEVQADSTGAGSILRMNESKPYDRTFTVYSTGLILDQPSFSTFEQFERVYGTLERFGEILEAETGQDITEILAINPSNALLRQFGDLVLAIKGSQVPIIGQWQTTTLTIKGATSDPTKGTIVKDQVSYRQNMDRLEVHIDFHQNTAGTAGSGTYFFPILSELGLTLNTSVMRSSSTEEEIGVVGSATVWDRAKGVLKMYSDTALTILANNAPSQFIGAIGSLSNATMIYSAHGFIPVNEYNATQSIGQQLGL